MLLEVKNQRLGDIMDEIHKVFQEIFRVGGDVYLSKAAINASLASR